MTAANKTNIAELYIYDQQGFGEHGRIGFLLVHGLGGSPVELRFVAQALSRAGFTVHCPLLAGHGGTEAELNATTWKDWYATLEKAHDDLKERCDMVVVGGLSAGALLALHLAAERPETVHATMHFSPTLWPNGWAIPKSFQLFQLIRHKWFARLFWFSECPPYGIKDERIRRFVLEALTSDGRPMKDIFGRSGGIVWEFRVMRDFVMKGVGRIKQPTLIFHPREDDQTDLSSTMKLMRRLSGPVEVSVLDDSYHMVTLDRQRQVVADRAIAFGNTLLARLAPQSVAKPKIATTAAE